MAEAEVIMATLDCRHQRPKILDLDHFPGPESDTDLILQCEPFLNSHIGIYVTVMSLTFLNQVF